MTQIWLTIGFITRLLRLSINKYCLEKSYLDRKLMLAGSIKSLINKRNKLQRLCIKGNSAEKTFLMRRQKVDKAIRFAKKNFYYKKFADCIEDSRQVFQVLNEVTGKRCQSRQINSLEVDGFQVYDYTEMANALNHHFVFVGPKLA